MQAELLPALPDLAAHAPAGARRRMALWLALLLLVAGLLATLIWLSGRYEIHQQQLRAERDAQYAASELRAGLSRNLQSLQALRGTLPQWHQDAQALLRDRRELDHLEWRDANFELLAAESSPYNAAEASANTRARDLPFGDLQLSCERARRQNTPTYSTSYFSLRTRALGLEVMELCLPITQAGQHQGFLVAVYALPALLAERVNSAYLQDQEISFTEPDGTRLAIVGKSKRSGQLFRSQQLLDLPGNTLVLRVDSWRAAPDLLPNVLTAMVALISLALLGVLALLGLDINRRLRTERELAQALAFRKAMEDSLVTGLRARDMQGHIRYVNPAFCAMTGFAAHELIGQQAPMPYWPPDLSDEYRQRQAIRWAGNQLPREGYESMFMRKAGERFPVRVFETPLRDAQGQQTGWMSAIVDISEQRRMEDISRTSQERVQASARLATLGEMASLLSHELNQPLAAISSFATGSVNMLGSAADAPSPAVRSDVLHALAKIAEQAERAGKVIRSVHDFVRRRESRHENIAPQALLDAVLPLVQLQARQLGAQVRCDGFAQAPAVRADRTLVEQVLLNLARNGLQAMQATPQPQRLLHLSVQAAAHRTTPPCLAISVADAGQGISPDTAGQLFTPFFSTKAEGMGLGLSLCRTVIEQHGGALTFGPNAEQGTIFTFTLPLAD